MATIEAFSLSTNPLFIAQLAALPGLFPLHITTPVKVSSGERNEHQYKAPKVWLSWFDWKVELLGSSSCTWAGPFGLIDWSPSNPWDSWDSNPIGVRGVDELEASLRSHRLF